MCSYQLGSAHGKLLPNASESWLAGLSSTILVVLCAMLFVKFTVDIYRGSQARLEMMFDIFGGYMLGL
jgi:hypothetical protein